MKLEPCPYCGGAAKLDATQAYRALVTGELGSAVAVYCRSCNAQMLICREDMPECDTDELMQMITENWNKRQRTYTREEIMPMVEAISSIHRLRYASHGLDDRFDAAIEISASALGIARRIGLLEDKP